MIVVEEHHYTVRFVAENNGFGTPWVRAILHPTKPAEAAASLGNGNIGLQVRFSREDLTFEEKMGEAQALAALLNDQVVGVQHQTHSRPSLEFVAQLPRWGSNATDDVLPTEPTGTPTGIMARLDVDMSGQRSQDAWKAEE